MKQTKTFKMGKTWATRFVDKKKQNIGWKLTNVSKTQQTVQKPNGKIFALFDTVSGIVTTDANIKDIQW